MPKPKGSRPVAFFDLSDLDGDIDGAVQRIMRVIEERSRERNQGGENRDGAHGRREPHEPGEPISIPLADENTPDPPQDR